MYMRSAGVISISLLSQAAAFCSAVSPSVEFEVLAVDSIVFALGRP